MKLKLPLFLLTLCTTSLGLAQADDLSQSFNPVPMQDDVIVSLPCDLHMAFRKVYTTNADSADGSISFLAGDQETSSQASQGTRAAFVTGGFKDAKGYYFLLGKYEITKPQFLALSKDDCLRINRSPTRVQNRKPAVNISKYDFEAAARKLTNFISKDQEAFSEYKAQKLYPVVRLPSDDEWEFAARGGLKANDNDYSKNLADYAHYLNAKADPYPAIIGSLKPNALGLFDMLGNVQEIMTDPYASTAGGSIQGGGGGFTVRGGSFRTPAQDVKVYTRMERPLINPKTGEENKSSDTGARFAIVLPINQSLEQIKAMNAASTKASSLSIEQGVSHNDGALKSILLYALLPIILILSCVLLLLRKRKKQAKIKPSQVAHEAYVAEESVTHAVATPNIVANETATQESYKPSSQFEQPEAKVSQQESKEASKQVVQHVADLVAKQVVDQVARQVAKQVTPHFDEKIEAKKGSKEKLEADDSMHSQNDSKSQKVNHDDNSVDYVEVTPVGKSTKPSSNTPSLNSSLYAIFQEHSSASTKAYSKSVQYKDQKQVQTKAQEKKQQDLYQVDKPGKSQGIIESNAEVLRQIMSAGRKNKPR